MEGLFTPDEIEMATLIMEMRRKKLSTGNSAPAVSSSGARPIVAPTASVPPAVPTLSGATSMVTPASSGTSGSRCTIIQKDAPKFVYEVEARNNGIVVSNKTKVQLKAELLAKGVTIPNIVTHAALTNADKKMLLLNAGVESKVLNKMKKKQLEDMMAEMNISV